METVANTTFTQPVTPVTGGGKSFFTAKIILFGTGLLTLISAILYFFILNPEGKEKASAECYSFDSVIESKERESTSPVYRLPEAHNMQSPESPKTLPVLSTTVSGLQPLAGQESEPGEQSQAIYIRDSKLKPEDTAYVFPVLTADEIKANHRQKKKMIEQLSRFHKDKYAYIPMGSFLYGNDTFSCRAFYIQTTEVSNLEYRTFLFDLLIEGKKKEFLKAKPDQEQWIKKFNEEAHLEPMKANYFSHPAYNDYPVVNISKEGAEMYCIWLSIAANQKLSEKSKALINDLRVPSDYEWVYAASNGKYKAKYANGTENLRDKRGLYIQNFNCVEYGQCRHDTLHDLYLYQSTKDKEVKPATDGGFLTTAVRSYAANAYGLYDLAGNVSEMVYLWDGDSNKARGFGTKGGSWCSPDYFLEIDARQEFRHPEKPSPLVGFRPVMTAVTPDKTKQ